VDNLRSLIREIVEETEVTEPISPDAIIFCDMDGVLVNFGAAIINLLNDLLDGGKLVGVSRSKGHFARMRNVQSKLGVDWRAKTRADLDIKPVRNFMFGAVGANPGPVFASMPPHQDAISALWPFLNSTGHTVVLLSAPITSRPGSIMTAAEGKELWAQQLKPSPSDIIITPAASKPQYAVTNGIKNILIDDKVSTVDAWNDRGGIGILHQPGNSSSTIDTLVKLGL